MVGERGVREERKALRKALIATWQPFTCNAHQTLKIEVVIYILHSLHSFLLRR